jgi:hypothetical protein
MVLLFNLNILEQKTQCDPEKLVKVLELFYNKKTIPKNSSSMRPINNLHGHSFLLNPALLFQDKYTDIQYKSQYIRLAGRRDYSQYKYYNTKYLDLSYYADLNLAVLKHNPLLTINENKLHFKYEEI